MIYFVEQISNIPFLLLFNVPVRFVVICLKKNDKLLLISAKNDATEESEKTFSFLDRISKTRSKNN